MSWEMALSLDLEACNTANSTQETTKEVNSIRSYITIDGLPSQFSTGVAQVNFKLRSCRFRNIDIS
jgi:hypothetical protein